MTQILVQEKGLGSPAESCLSLDPDRDMRERHRGAGDLVHFCYQLAA